MLIHIVSTESSMSNMRRFDAFWTFLVNHMVCVFHSVAVLPASAFPWGSSALYFPWAGVFLADPGLFCAAGLMRLAAESALSSHPCPRHFPYPVRVPASHLVARVGGLPSPPGQTGRKTFIVNLEELHRLISHSTLLLMIEG